MKEEPKEKRFNCWNCKYRGEVPGSAHICCNHPSLGAINNDPMVQLLGILAGAGRVPPVNITNKKLNIKGNPHGIRSGWFNFPVNFDPVWLENCDGYEKKEEVKK